MRTITPPLGGVRTYGAAFKAASDVGTISFVKTKRNRAHDTQMPSETFFSDGIALFGAFKAS